MLNNCRRTKVSWNHHFSFSRLHFQEAITKFREEITKLDGDMDIKMEIVWTFCGSDSSLMFRCILLYKLLTWSKLFVNKADGSCVFKAICICGSQGVSTEISDFLCILHHNQMIAYMPNFMCSDNDKFISSSYLYYCIEQHYEL